MDRQTAAGSWRSIILFLVRCCLRSSECGQTTNVQRRGGRYANRPCRIGAWMLGMHLDGQASRYAAQTCAPSQRPAGHSKNQRSFGGPPFVFTFHHFTHGLDDHFTWRDVVSVRLAFDFLPEFGWEARALFSACCCHAVHFFILVHLYQ